MSKEFFKIMSKSIGEDIHVLEDGLNSSEISGWIDTGSYMFNALLSGSLFKGLPGNRITCFAAPEASGKTLFTFEIINNFLRQNNENVVWLYDTESAANKDTAAAHNCDSNRIVIREPETIEQFKTDAAKTLDAYMEQIERPNMLMVLDSLGMLSTSKEMSDTVEGKDVSDMTRARQIKAAFRVLTLKLAKAKVPMIITNHLYQMVGSYVPTKEQSGGSGIKYAASTIVYLSKKKDKDGTDILGNIITATAIKSRLSRENSQVEIKLSYKTGLDRYYGLLDLGEEFNIIPRIGNKYEFPDGSKHFQKAIYNEPERFFTTEIMQRLEEAANKKFQYGDHDVV